MTTPENPSPSRQSFNDGFWDGYHDTEANRKPLWEGREHPNKDYGAGYKMGVEAHANGSWYVYSSESAWIRYQAYNNISVD